MTLALEINDAGLILARDGHIVAEEPGCAMLDGREPQTGAAAVRRLRLQPLYAETRHWQDIGAAALPRPMPAATSLAEVAHAQLAQLARGASDAASGALFAVPAWYTREQLAVLLGVASEAGLPAVGLVDAAVAAAALEPAPASTLHLELTLHRAVLTVLEHSGELRRTRYELLPQHGWLALQQAWIDMIAAEFVRRTRFDPLHEAASEQRLWDSLPAWLEALERDDTLTIELPAAGSALAIELSRAQFVAAVRPLYDAVAHMLQRARPAAGALHVRVSHRWLGLPGFMAHLSELRDCELRPLPRGAAALGALAFERALRRDGAQLALVQRLPVPLARGPAAVTEAAARVPAADRPTHVVHRGRAWPLGGVPLQIGSAVAGVPRALSVPAGPGISRLHCRLSRDADGAWLDDQSTYGTYLNGERVGGRVALRAGDRLRLGSPGVEFELVHVVEGDGPA
ncbi:MAG: FHA domain-containing protein [Steroidobacteraceae bacterium]|nr:FHA domain-containing protein [Steroidobacteraceae bacterium]